MSNLTTSFAIVLDVLKHSNNVVVATVAKVKFHLGHSNGC